MGRSTEVQNFLKARGAPFTVREICAELGYPADQSKYVSSLLTTWLAHGKVTARKSMCSMTNKMVNIYAWSDAGADAWKNQKRQARQQKPKATTEEQRRAEMYRRAAEESKKRREQFYAEQLIQDAASRAWLDFARITGCRAKDADAVKAAYRQAALRHHPDRGGNKEIFIELATAYNTIKGAIS